MFALIFFIYLVSNETKGYVCIFWLFFMEREQKNLFTVLTEETSIPDDDDKWDK